MTGNPPLSSPSLKSLSLRSSSQDVVQALLTETKSNPLARKLYKRAAFALQQEALASSEGYGFRKAGGGHYATVGEALYNETGVRRAFRERDPQMAIATLTALFDFMRQKVLGQGFER